MTELKIWCLETGDTMLTVKLAGGCPLLVGGERTEKETEGWGGTETANQTEKDKEGGGGYRENRPREF